MEAIIGEPQQGGRLLSLKDDERKKRARWGEMKRNKIVEDEMQRSGKRTNCKCSSLMLSLNKIYIHLYRQIER